MLASFVSHPAVNPGEMVRRMGDAAFRLAAVEAMDGGAGSL
ncbi:MAG: hypothetical protein VKI82_07485 [Leptolyngbya sp.]|nr:hypothetical protein [Leptolyngbya sp.]